MCGLQIAPLSYLKCGCSKADVVMLLTLDVRQAGSRLGGPEVGLLGPVLGLSAQTSEMGSLFGLEVIKLTVPKAASLMSVVMYSDTFTGTVICKDTTRQMEGKKTQT